MEHGVHVTLDERTVLSLLCCYVEPLQGKAKESVLHELDLLDEQSINSEIYSVGTGRAVFDLSDSVDATIRMPVSLDMDASSFCCRTKCLPWHIRIEYAAIPG